MNTEPSRLRHTASIAALAAVLALGAMPGALAAPAAPPKPPAPAITASVPMKKDGGVYVVPVSINGQVTFDCIVDSGASDVNIPTAVFQKLVRSGSIQKSDYLGMQEYTLADGSSERGRTFRIRSMKVGSMVVQNVVASVGGDESSALLGQSFLERFHTWSLDNSHHALVLLGPPSPGPHLTTIAAAHPPGGGHPAPDSGAGTEAQTPPRHTVRTPSAESPDTSDDDDHLTAQHSGAE